MGSITKKYGCLSDSRCVKIPETFLGPIGEYFRKKLSIKVPHRSENRVGKVIRGKKWICYESVKKVTVFYFVTYV